MEALNLGKQQGNFSNCIRSESSDVDKLHTSSALKRFSFKCVPMCACPGLLRPADEGMAALAGGSEHAAEETRD